MRLVKVPGALRLKTPRHIALVRLLGDAVVEKIADPVWRKLEARIAVETGNLEIEWSLAAQIAQNPVLRDFVLPLVKIDAGIVALSVHRQPQRGLESCNIGDLEIVVRGAQNGGHAAIVVQYILEVGEPVVLGCPVMMRIGTSVGGFDAELVG
jgi:hypothetical protein